MTDQWITTTEAAQISGYHPERIRELLRENQIKGRKFGTIWQVDRQSLEVYLHMMEVRGAKRGPKPTI